MGQPVGDKALDYLFHEARTHAAWQNKKVEDSILVRIYETLRFGPTSANCCPLRTVFVRTDEGKEKLKSCLSPGNVDKTMAAPVTAIFAFDREFYQFYPRLFPHYDFRSGYEKDPERANKAGHFNATLQASYAIIVARGYGLDCGPMAGFSTDKVDDLFFQNQTWRSFLLCNIGYGLTDTDRVRDDRLTFDEACRLA